jgi:hypothetical protein
MADRFVTTHTLSMTSTPGPVNTGLARSHSPAMPAKETPRPYCLAGRSGERIQVRADQTF